MTDDNSVHVTSTRTQDPASLPNNNDQVRWFLVHQVQRFLVRATVALMFLALVAYVLTKDVAVLGTTTIIGVAVIAIFRYYFTLSRKE